MHAMRRLSRTAGLHVVAATESDLLALGMLACVVQTAIPLLVFTTILALFTGASIALCSVTLG